MEFNPKEYSVNKTVIFRNIPTDEVAKILLTISCAYKAYIRVVSYYELVSYYEPDGRSEDILATVEIMCNKDNWEYIKYDIIQLKEGYNPTKVIFK